MTQAQVDAINSGITANKVSTYDGYANDIAWKQDALTAGTNIQISAQNVISATDTTYSAGTNVQISNQNVISATDTKYTAWKWINIDANNEISNTLPWAIVSSTAPSNASQWDLWYDTTTDQLNSYDGSSWNPVDIDTTYTGGSGIEIDANNEITVKLAQNSWLWINASDELEVDTSVIQTKMYSAGSTAPASPNAWDLWYDTTNDQLNSYDGTSWNPVWAWTGDVVWPSSATDWHLAVFDWATGKLLKDWWVIPVWLSSQTGNVFTSWMTIWGGSSSDYSSLTPAPNTAYLII